MHFSVLAVLYGNPLELVCRQQGNLALAGKIHAWVLYFASDFTASHFFSGVHPIF